VVDATRRAIFDVPLPGGRILRLGERTLVMAIIKPQIRFQTAVCMSSGRDS
jgi:hypothetical protein